MKLQVTDALERAAQLHSSGRLDEAKKYYLAILAAQPDNPDALHNHGVLQVDLGDPQGALVSIKKALKIHPASAQYWTSYIDTLLKTGKTTEAGKALQLAARYSEKNASLSKLENLLRSPKIDLAYPLSYVQQMFRKGLYAQAQPIAKKLLEAHPDSSICLNIFGAISIKLDNPEDAISALKEAVRLSPDFSEAYNNLGTALELTEDYGSARDAYYKAFQLDTAPSEAALNLLSMLERLNKIADLRHFISEVRDKYPEENTSIQYFEAKLLSREKNHAGVIEILEGIDLSKIQPSRRASFLELHAKTLQEVGRFDEAFERFEEMNSIRKTRPDFDAALGAQTISNARSQLKQMERIELGKRTPDLDASGHENLAFIIGFPRSGTTLLDTILRSHSGIDVIEEKEMVRAAEKALGFRGDLKELYSMSEDAISEARRVYRTTCRQYVEEANSKHLLVDKLPLNILKLPFINALFPEAKFILCVRHPLDSIFSCWSQNFSLNSAMMNMVDLDKAVDFYCTCMETLKASEAKLDVRVHRVSYERLVQDMRSQTGPLLEFLGLEWEDQLSSYSETALNRGKIYTPSYSQVVEPLYEKASYRWRHYQKYLEPYFDKVKPWVEEFGYDL